MPEMGQGPRREVPKPELIELDNTAYKKRANELFEKHHDEISRAFVLESGAIDRALHSVPDEVLRRYWGHGVTRGDMPTQIAALLSMLDNKFYLGYAGVIRGGQPDAYANGSFFVISRKDGPSIIKGYRDGTPQRVRVRDSSGNETIGVRMDPGAFVLNGHMASLLPDLRAMYPNERIILPDELPKYIEEQERSAT